MSSQCIKMSKWTLNRNDVMTDNVHLKTNKYLEFTVQSYLGGLICFLTEGLNEITLPSGKKKKRQRSNWKSTGPILDSLFLNHYPLVWGNSNLLSRSLDFHWEWPVRLDSSLHECLTRLSTEFSPSLFFFLSFSPFLSVILSLPGPETHPALLHVHART